MSTYALHKHVKSSEMYKEETLKKSHYSKIMGLARTPKGDYSFCYITCQIENIT